MKVLCSGFLLRYPLGGFSWHHLQYLAGFQAMGHHVTYFEDHGWSGSCYDPRSDAMTDDPGYGIRYLVDLLRPFGLQNNWCFLGSDGAAHGMSREQLSEECRQCDVYFNLSGINWIPELEQCRRRVLIDTDPVFTQIDGHGNAGAFSWYHSLFTYGENVHKPGCDMPTAGERWLPTRQPVVLPLWHMAMESPSGAFTTVMNWSAYGDREYAGRVFGQKDREFKPFFSLPQQVDEQMELAVNAPLPIVERLRKGGWSVMDSVEVTRNPQDYQSYLRKSTGEFSVAKHAYVCTRSGWFSDRSTGYLATGRPVILQDTGFSGFLPCGSGLLTYTTPAEAHAAIRAIRDNYKDHCKAARRIVEEFFDSNHVLHNLLELSID